MWIRGRRCLLPALLAFAESIGLASSSFRMSRHRSIPLRAHDHEGGVEDAEDPLHRKRATPRKRDPYKFGDITRSVARSTTSGVEEVVRSMSGNQEYKFGDMTKQTVGITTNGIEGLVQSVTGNEDYKFGDLTRKTMQTAGGVVTYSKKSLGLIRDNNIHELVALMNLYWTEIMNSEERREASVVLLYLGATIILAYNFVANAMQGMVFAAAWTIVSIRTGTSPLSQGMWSKLLGTKSALDMFFGGPCTPVRAVLTIPWFFHYRRFVVSLACCSPLRGKHPITRRLVSVIVSCLVANVVFVGGVTLLLVKVLSLWTGVPVFPTAQ